MSADDYRLRLLAAYRAGQIAARFDRERSGRRLTVRRKVMEVPGPPLPTPGLLDDGWHH